MTANVLRLYKQLLRYGERLRLTDKTYFQTRIRKAFKENKDLTDETKINFQIEKAQKLLENERVV